MKCKIDYIENLDWKEDSNEIKDKLYNTLSAITKDLKQASGLFYNSKTKLFTTRKPVGEASKEVYDKAEQSIYEINKKYNGTFVSLVENPFEDNSNYFVVKLDVLTPLQTIIRDNLNDPNYESYLDYIEKNISDKDFITLSETLFGYTFIAQQDKGLSDRLREDLDELTPKLNEFIEKADDNLSGIIAELTSNSYFYGFRNKRTLGSILNFIRSDRETVLKTTRLVNDSLSRLSSLKNTVLKEGQGLTEIFNYLQSVDINKLTPEEEIEYEKQSEKAATILNDVKPYLQYFEPLDQLYKDMKESGVSSDPFSIFNGITLEENLLSILKQHFSEIDSISFLEEAYETTDNVQAFKENIIGRFDNETKPIIRNELDLAFSDATKKTKDGKPYEQDLFSYLETSIRDYGDIIKAVKGYDLEFATTRIHNMLKKQTDKFTYEDVKEMILVEDDGDNYITKMLASPTEMRDVGVQSFVKIIDDRLKKATIKKQDIQTTIENLERQNKDNLEFYSSMMTEERLHLPLNEPLTYLDLDDENPDSKVISIAGIQKRVLLKRNRFWVTPKDYIRASLEKRIFFDNIDEYTESLLNLFNTSSFEVLYSDQYDSYYIPREQKDVLISNVRQTLNLPTFNLSQSLIEALYTHKGTSDLELKKAAKRNLTSAFFSNMYTKKSSEDIKDILDKQNVFDLLKKGDLTREDDEKKFDNLKNKYFFSHDINDIIEDLPKLKYKQGYERKDADGVVQGSLYALTSNNKFIELPYFVEEGKRYYIYSEFQNEEITEVYSLNSKFSEPNKNYNSEKYRQFENLLNSDSQFKKSYETLKNYYDDSRARTKYELEYGMIPQVESVQEEKSWKEKLKNPKKLVEDTKKGFVDAFKFQKYTLEDQTRIIKARKNYSYTVEEVDKEGVIVEKTYEVEEGDLVDAKGHLIFDEEGNKETNEEKGARATVFDIGLDGSQIKRVTKRYTRPLKVENLESNIFTNIKKYATYAVGYSETNAASVEGSVMLSAFKNRKLSKKALNKKGIASQLKSRFGKKAQEGALLSVKIMSDYLDTNVYGKAFNSSTIKIGKQEFDTFSATNKLKAVIAFQSLAFNLVAPIGNLTIGGVNNLLMALQGNVLDLKTFGKANKVFLTEMKNGFYTDIFSTDINNKSFMGQVFAKFQAIQGTDYSIDEQVEKEGFGIREFAFLTTSLPEIKLQGTLALGILMKTPHKDSNVYDTLVDLYKESKKPNSLTFSQLVTDEIGTDNLVTLIQKIQMANTKAHGNYVKSNKSQLQRYAVFEFALIFKRWIYSGILNRFGQERYSVMNNRDEEGYQRLFLSELYKGLMNDSREGGFINNIPYFLKELGKSQIKTAAHVGNAMTFGKLETIDAVREFLYDPDMPENKQTEMFRASVELAIFIGATFLAAASYGLGKGDGDEEDNRALLTLSYYITRFQNDVGFFLPYATVPGVSGGIGVLNTWDNARRILFDPFTIERTLDNNIGLLGQMIGWYEDEDGVSHPKLTEKYKTSGNSYKKGDYKIWRKLKKSALAPVYQVDRLLNIEDQINYLEMMRTTSK